MMRESTYEVHDRTHYHIGEIWCHGFLHVRNLREALTIAPTLRGRALRWESLESTGFSMPTLTKTFASIGNATNAAMGCPIGSFVIIEGKVSGVYPHQRFKSRVRLVSGVAVGVA